MQITWCISTIPVCWSAEASTGGGGADWKKKNLIKGNINNNHFFQTAFAVQKQLDDMQPAYSTANETLANTGLCLYLHDLCKQG